MATIVETRKKLLNNPEAASMICPSAKNEIYMDLNGDGKADFAMIDSKGDFTGKGAIDTFAMDLGNDGDFDLYMRDTDGNFVGDEITYFKDGEDEPVIKTHPEQSGKMIESAIHGPALKSLQVLHGFVDGQISADEFKSGMKECGDGVRAALRTVLEAYKMGQKN